MATSRPVRWLRLIGVSAALLVAAGLLAAGISAFQKWRRAERLRALSIEETRTYRRPLLETSKIWSVAVAAKSLAPLRQSTAASRDVVNYVVLPSFPDLDGYAMTITPADDENVARLAMVVFRASAAAPAVTFKRRYDFVVAKADYQTFSRTFDSLTADWGGDATSIYCMDGMETAFERRKDSLVTSGAGNAECNAHYGEIDSLVGRLIIPHAPEDAQIGPHWSDRSKTGKVPPAGK